MIATDKSITVAREIAARVRSCGGTAYYVGGFVRDKLRGEENKDVDIEVHGVTPQCLEEILDSIGGKITKGKSFGVYGIRGCDLDIAMPRKEENRGTGHRDFDIFVDPFLGVYKAAVRRDFTVNAIMQDVLTDEIIDPFNGINDIKHGIIRHVNDNTFTEDPLRVLRGAQFAARFGYTVAPETTELCKTVDLSALASERVFAETEKALLKAEKPSVYFEALRVFGKLSLWFRELEDTVGVPQNPVYHREGDVWTHTMMVIDKAAEVRDKASSPIGFMLSAVAHDFGKTVCTELVNGQLRSYNHDVLGLPLVGAFMKRLTSERDLTEYVLNMCKLHMKPNMLAAAHSSIKATNRLFDESVDPYGLILLATADSLGKISEHEYVPYDGFFAQRLEIYREYMSRPYVMGRDLIAAGIKPSVKFTEYLEFAHKLRLAGVEKESVMKQILSMARKDKKKNGE